MNNADDSTRDDQLDAYLDGQLSESQRHEFAESLRFDDVRCGQVELQSKIDRKLKELFHAPFNDERKPFVANVPGSREQSISVFLGGRRWWWAAAAALAAIALAWTWTYPSRPVPHFQAMSLAKVYHETLRNGFQPYYKCEDPERFAHVFASRQGVPLKLLPMPDGSQMLGISYPGGLSRDTTAMLCLMDGEPVMVFVDRLESDKDIAAATAESEKDTHVFRDVRNGLVFYEVSRFDRPRAIDYLAIAARDAVGR